MYDNEKLLTTRLLMMIFNPFNLLIQSSEFSLDYRKPHTAAQPAISNTGNITL